MKDNEKLLQVAIKNNDTLLNTCSSIWKYIIEQPANEQERLFTTFLKQIDFRDIQIVDYKAFFDTTSRAAADIIALEARIVSNMVQQNISEELFYHNLWNKICDKTLLLEQSAQVSFLERLWMDVCIPYYQITEGCTMEDEEFSNIRQEISQHLKKANYILAYPFQQRTQRASLLQLPTLRQISHLSPLTSHL